MTFTSRILAPIFVALIALPVSGQETDPDLISASLTNELLRAAPHMAEDPEAQLGIAARVLEPKQNIRSLPAPEQQELRERAKAWMTERASETSELPLEIEIQIPAALGRNEDGSFVLRPNVGSKQQFARGTLDAMTLPLSGLGQLSYRPEQPFDLTGIRPDPQLAEELQGLIDKRTGVMLVATMTVTQIEPAPANGSAAVAGGRIEALAIHHLGAKDRVLVADRKILDLTPEAGQPANITLAGIEQVLRLQARDGGYVDSRENDQGALIQLLQWRSLTAMPAEDLLDRGVAPDILWRAFTEFAPRSLQDSMVPPHQRDARSGALRADVDEFERRRIDAAIIRTIFPQIAAAMPADPIRVTAIESAQVRDYDFDRKGFPVVWPRGGWVLGGQYPIVANLPDFLPMSEDEAQQLLARPGFSDSSNSKWLTLVAEFGLAARDVTWPDNQPLPQIVPGFDLVSVSLHTGRNHASDEARSGDLLMTLDPQEYRGPARPVASKDDLAMWTGWTEDRGARGEDLIAAALTVAEDRDGLLDAMNRRGQTSDPAAAASGLTMPQPLVLTGQLGFVNPGGVWQPSRFQWRFWTNESPLNPPQIELADLDLLRDPPLDDAQEQAMQAIGGSVQYRAIVEPVQAVVKAGQPTLYVRLKEIALFSPQKDDSGLPLLRVVLNAGNTSAVAAETPSPAAVASPDLVVLDHDYLDLLLFRELADDLDDATLDRMLLDRLYRELRAGSQGDLPWGRFFQPLPDTLNRVQRSEMLPQFRAWQDARAAALPTQVVLRVATNALSGSGCAVTSYADVSQAGGFSDGVRQMLEEMHYDQVAAAVGATLTTLEKIARDVPERRPVLAPRRLAQLGGRPLYQLLRASRNISAAQCAGQERLDAVTDGFDPAASLTADAVIVVENPVLIANERRQVVETRQLGDITGIDFVSATGQTATTQGTPRQAGTFRLTLTVRDSIFYGQDALPTPQQPSPPGQPVRLPVADVAALKVDPPAVVDILGMSLNDPKEKLDAALSVETPTQREYLVALPRDIAPKPVAGRGTLPATEAMTEARMRIDGDSSEVMLGLFDQRARPGPIALGRAKLYDPAEVTDQGLAGALVKKYGQPTFAKQDRRGGAALNRYVWGYHPAISMPQCLPDFGTTAARELRDSFAINDDTDRQFFDLGQAMIWPQIETLTEQQPDFSVCGPAVIAEITTYRGKLSLTSYVIDLSPLQSLEWKNERRPTDPVAEAADIDL